MESSGSVCICVFVSVQVCVLAGVFCSCDLVVLFASLEHFRKTPKTSFACLLRLSKHSRSSGVSEGQKDLKSRSLCHFEEKQSAQLAAHLH